MAWLLSGLQLVLSVVLIVAGTGKLLQLEDFGGALRLSHLPEAMVGPLRVVIPVLECFLALALLLSTPRSLEGALATTAGLFVVFTLWMVWVLARRLHLHCGCFGASGADVSWTSVMRNLLLLLLAAGGTGLAGQVKSQIPATSVWMDITVTAFAMIVALLTGLRAGLPSLVLTVDQLLVLDGGTPVEGKR